MLLLQIVYIKDLSFSESKIRFHGNQPVGNLIHIFTERKNKMENTIRVNLPTIITNEDIDDIMSSALDWISYWCEKVEVVGDYLGEYASEQISRGGELRFYLVEAITDNDPEYFSLNREKLIKGIYTWFDTVDDDARFEVIDIDFTSFLLGLDTGYIDGPRADSIIQLALFGEEVFC